MPSALLLPLLTCSAVLLLSGATKLASPTSVDAAFGSMRVPAPLDAAWVRRLLPWLEIALGLWLLVSAGAALVVVALAVLVLFLAYLALVVRAALEPAPADCGCFGSVGDSRVTMVTVWRNGLLVLAALLTVVAGVRDVSVLTDLRVDGVWAWLVAALLAVAVAVLVTWRSPVDGEESLAGHATVDDDGEYVRTTIPRAQVLTEDGQLVLVESAARRAAHLLVFLSPGCGGCQRIGPDLAGWQADLDPVVVRAVVNGSPSVTESLPYLAGHWFDQFGVTRDAFAIGAPGAVLLGTDGQLAGGPVQGEDAVRDFVVEVGEHLRAAREEAEAAARDAVPELQPLSDDR